MQRLLLPPKLFYFGWFMALGTFTPFVSLYYREVGLDLAQIGLLAALPGLLQMVAGPIWGIVADMLRIHRALLPLAVFGTLLPVWLLGTTSSFTFIIVLVATQALFTAPVTALADNATLTLLGERRERYGAQRLWGAVGWGTSTMIFGWLIDRFGLGITFPSYALVGALTGLVALLLPGSHLVQVNLRAAAGTLVRDSRWAIFLGCVFLIGCASSSVHGFLSLYLQDLGAGGEEIGIASVIASVAEVASMAFAPLALRRWSARPLIVTAGLLFTLRCMIYVVAPSSAWVLAAQLLHGPCFGLLWVAGVNETQRLAPVGLEATAQSLFGITFFGLASMLASVAGGWIYRDFGSGALFSTVSALSLIGALILLIDYRFGSVKSPPLAIAERQP